MSGSKSKSKSRSRSGSISRSGSSSSSRSKSRSRSRSSSSRSRSSSSRSRSRSSSSRSRSRSRSRSTSRSGSKSRSSSTKTSEFRFITSLELTKMSIKDIKKYMFKNTPPDINENITKKELLELHDNVMNFDSSFKKNKNRKIKKVVRSKSSRNINKKTIENKGVKLESGVFKKLSALINKQKKALEKTLSGNSKYKNRYEYLKMIIKKQTTIYKNTSRSIKKNRRWDKNRSRKTKKSNSYNNINTYTFLQNGGRKCVTNCIGNNLSSILYAEFFHNLKKEYPEDDMTETFFILLALEQWIVVYQNIYRDYVKKGNIQGAQNINTRRKIPNITIRNNAAIIHGKARDTDYNPMLLFYKNIYEMTRAVAESIHRIDDILEKPFNEVLKLIKDNIPVIHPGFKFFCYYWGKNNEWNSNIVIPRRIKLNNLQPIPGEQDTNSDSNNNSDFVIIENNKRGTYKVPQTFKLNDIYINQVGSEIEYDISIPHWVFAHANPPEEDTTRITALGKNMYEKGIDQIIALENGTSDGNRRPYNYTESMIWDGLKKLSYINRNQSKIKFIDGHHWDMQCMELDKALMYLENVFDMDTVTSIHCTAGFGRTTSVILLLVIGCTLINLNDENIKKFLKEPFNLKSLPYRLPHFKTYQTIIEVLYDKRGARELINIDTIWKTKLFMDRLNIILQASALFIKKQYKLGTIKIPQYRINNLPKGSVFWVDHHPSWPTVDRNKMLGNQHVISI